MAEPTSELSARPTYVDFAGWRKHATPEPLASARRLDEQVEADHRRTVARARREGRLEHVPAGPPGSGIAAQIRIAFGDAADPLNPFRARSLKRPMRRAAQRIETGKPSGGG
jgi:hypothetical protein